MNWPEHKTIEVQWIGTKERMVVELGESFPVAFGWKEEDQDCLDLSLLSYNVDCPQHNIRCDTMEQSPTSITLLLTVDPKDSLVEKEKNLDISIVITSSDGDIAHTIPLPPHTIKNAQFQSSPSRRPKRAAARAATNAFLLSSDAPTLASSAEWEQSSTSDPHPPKRIDTHITDRAIELFSRMEALESRMDHAIQGVSRTLQHPSNRPTTEEAPPTLSLEEAMNQSLKAFQGASDVAQWDWMQSVKGALNQREREHMRAILDMLYEEGVPKVDTRKEKQPVKSSSGCACQPCPLEREQKQLEEFYKSMFQQQN